jgi:hypothetical protein
VKTTTSRCDRPARRRRRRQLLAGYPLHAQPRRQTAPTRLRDSRCGAKQRKLLYYRNPMGLADTSPTPKKDPMGMDYIAVYEGEDESAPAGSAGAAASPNQVRISTEKIQKLGVRTEAAACACSGRRCAPPGASSPTSGGSSSSHRKFEGYVERLHVNATGQAVAKGQPLFEAYSPELVSAQREYAIAMQGSKR